MNIKEFYKRYDKTYFNKIIIVFFKDKTTYQGLFTDIFDEDNSIIVGGMWINISDIEEIKLL